MVDPLFDSYDEEDDFYLDEDEEDELESDDAWEEDAWEEED
jgi:hypothetical protein